MAFHATLLLQNPLFVVEKLISYEVINTLMNSSDRGEAAGECNVCVYRAMSLSLIAI